MKKISVVFGTRPELIKVTPVIKAFCRKEGIKMNVCFTGQHKEMVEPLLKLFDIRIDYSLDIMEKGQSLSHLNGKALFGMDKYMEREKPDFVLVQGDTTTAMSTATTAFYHGIPVGHIEAGLRTNRIDSPFPEEFNRRIISLVSTLHFAPTDLAKENLLKEGYPLNNIFVTGNTVIDCLFSTLSHIEKIKYTPPKELFQLTKLPFVLITGHRRENFGRSFENICNAIKILAASHTEFSFIYPVHLNPNVQEPVYRLLKGIANIHLIPPLDYIDFIFMMEKCYCLLSDSGGIQEEAAALNRPVLVMRENSERMEGVKSGTSLLVGTNPQTIIDNVNNLIENKDRYNEMANACNPFGDGRAAEKIIQIIRDYLK